MSKFKYHVSLFVWLLLLSINTAQARDDSHLSRPMLWEINTTPPSYLFGTIHLPDPRLSNLGSLVETAFKRSDAVYTEIDLKPESILQTAQHIIRTDGKTLNDVLPEDVQNLLNARLTKISPQLSTVALEPMKTWAIYAMVVVLEQQIKYPGLKALDQMLFQRALEAGKKTGGIETVDEQLHYFEQFTEDEQISLLRNTLEQLNAMEAKGENPIEILLQWYFKGDAESFTDLMAKLPMADDEKLNQQIMKTLLMDRNKIMAERIGKILSKKTGESYFFAVGAAHLGGEQSVLHHLEKMGYSGNQVTATLIK